MGSKWLLVLAAMVPTTSISSVEIRVPADVPTIQGAIEAAVSGDSILVAPGTYNENINYRGKNVRIESEQGADVTIINGGMTAAVVVFENAETREAVLRGFTITNGRGFEGGGIGVSWASPSIEKNVITENSACMGAGIGLSFASPLIKENSITGNFKAGCTGGSGGGGIFIGGASTPEIIGNLIANNRSTGGAGISMNAAGTPIIRDNEISGNVSTGEGGGLALGNRSEALITQNLIYGNSAAKGGGLSWLVPLGTLGPTLINNTIAHNDSPQGSGIFADGFDGPTLLVSNIIVGFPGQSAVFCGDFNDVESPIFEFNLVYTEAGTAYGGICPDFTGISGNISADPLFTDVVPGDFRLMLESPAVDAASNIDAPLLDFSGNPRPVDGDGDGVAVADMGALELVGPFADVPPRYWAVYFITTIADNGITRGCGDGRFCPESAVTRAQMAVFLERGINGAVFSPPPAAGNVFNDVGTNDFAAAFIEQLFADGITAGCGGGNYCPNNPVTRAQMAVLLLRAKHGADYSPPPATGFFDDVDLSHWAVHWIEQLAAEGITSGCGNNNYCPDDPVTRAQMAVFVVRTFGL